MARIAATDTGSSQFFDHRDPGHGHQLGTVRVAYEALARREARTRLRHPETDASRDVTGSFVVPETDPRDPKRRL